jgi:HPt (histidine-containing phosphotransfer) domain-containing protein
MNNKNNETETLAYAMKLKRDIYDYLSINFGDEIIGKLLETTVTTMDEYIENIEKNFISKDNKELISNFHAFQGMLLNLGLDSEAKTAKIIQNMIKEGDIENIDFHVENFTKNISDLLIVLKKNLT